MGLFFVKYVIMDCGVVVTLAQEALSNLREGKCFLIYIFYYFNYFSMKKLQESAFYFHWLLWELLLVLEGVPSREGVNILVDIL